MDQDGWRAC